MWTSLRSFPLSVYPRQRHATTVSSGNYPTLALPLTGEGTRISSPCEGGGWEGVVAAPKPAKHFTSSTRTKGVPTCN